MRLGLRTDPIRQGLGFTSVYIASEATDLLAAWSWTPPVISMAL